MGIRGGHTLRARRPPSFRQSPISRRRQREVCRRSGSRTSLKRSVHATTIELRTLLSSSIKRGYTEDMAAAVVVV